MKYGVIVCPKCKNAKGAILSYKTTRCTRCGKNIKLENIRVLYKTNSEKELRLAVGQINEEINRSDKKNTP